MTDAPRDNNQIPTALGTLQSDGETPTPIEADPSSHTLATDDGTTGSDNSSSDEAYRDNNHNPVMIAVSESDGITPVHLYVDGDGKLLVDSN